MKLDLQKFIEVKLLRDKYRSQNKYLEFYNLEQESKTYGDSLSLLSDQLYWEKAEDYLKLVDLFVNTEMTVEEFRTQFYDLRESAEAYYKQLIEQLKSTVQSEQLTINKMEINPKSKRFIKIIDEPIFDLLESYNPDIILEEGRANPNLISIALSGSVLKSRIKKNIKLKLENYCAGKLRR